MKSSNINIRVDRELKEKCEKIYESMGINMSIAINLFLNQTVRVNGIPFEILACNNVENVIEGKKSTLKICNKKIECIEKDNMYFIEYNNLKYVIAFESIYANELCIYPNTWKIENRGVLPSVVHYETSNINEYKSKFFDKMLSLTDYENKIIVMKNVDRISIHPNHNKKQLLMPEDKVNGINIVKESEVDNLLKYYNDFFEKKEYIID